MQKALVSAPVGDLPAISEIGKQALARSSARDRALLSSMASGAVIRVITALISMGYFAVSVRALTHIQFGALATIATFTGFMAFADFGIGSGLMTKLAVAHGRDDKSAARSMVSGAWSAVLALGLLAALVGSLLAVTLPWSRILGMPPGHDAEIRAAVLACAICAGLAVPANIGQRILVAKQRGATANIWLLVTTCATLGVIATASVASGPLWCFVMALVGTPMVVGAVQSIWVLCVVYPDLRPRYRLVTRSSFGSLGRVSCLFLALNIAVTLAFQCDLLIVSSSLGAASAASYAVGLRMFGVLSGVLSGASQQLWTSMAEALERGDRDWVRTRFLRVLSGTSAISISCCLVLILLGRPIVRAWTGGDLVPSTGLLLAFAVWTVYALAMTQVGFLLNAAQVVGPQMMMALGMTLLNIALSIYLTHRIGLLGPLVGSLVAHAMTSGVPTIILARRVLREPRPRCQEAE